MSVGTLLSTTLQVVAREGVADRHCFSQCILHVWCETERTARLLEAEYLGIVYFLNSNR